MKKLNFILFESLVSALKDVFPRAVPSFKLTQNHEGLSLLLKVNDEIKDIMVECKNYFSSFEVENCEESEPITAKEMGFIKEDESWKLKINPTNFLEISGLNRLLLSALKKARQKKRRCNVSYYDIRSQNN